MRRLTLLALLAVLTVPATASAGPGSRIVGGTDAHAGEFPYVANIFIGAGAGFACTGTLIAPDWVMTAGHCGTPTGEAAGSPVPFPAAAYTVTLDTVAADGTGGEEHGVSEVHIDPDYLGGAGYDVSLLKLSTPSKVAPMRIAARSERAIWEPGKLMTIAGFGTTKSGGDTPDTMQVAQVPIISDADCAKAYPGGLPVLDTPGFDAESMVCAAYPQGGIDTCQGDSGGPLLAALPAGGLRLVGATSYGEGCAEPGKPGVYARVADAYIRAFVEGLVPAAYAAENGSTTTTTPAATATPAATPVTTATPTPGSGAQPTPTPGPATTSCPATTLRFGKRFRRVRVKLGGRTLYAKRSKGVKRFRFTPPAGTGVLKIIAVDRRGVRKVTTRIFSDCRVG